MAVASVQTPQCQGRKQDLTTSFLGIGCEIAFKVLRRLLDSGDMIEGSRLNLIRAAVYSGAKAPF